MTKTIAQLRAEAVKRLTKLNEHGYWEFPVHVALCGRDVPDVDEERAIIADLLTDDCGPCYSCAKLAELRAENSQLRVKVDDLVNGNDGETNGIRADVPLVDDLPDGDAVEILRKSAKGFQGGTGNVIKNAKMLLGMNVERGLDIVLLETLADMVERDYVPRKQWAEAVRAMKAAQDRMEQARDERDEWKARAESSSKVRAGSSNLDWLFEHDRDFSGTVIAAAQIRRLCPDDCETPPQFGEWLMAPYEDEGDESCRQDADQREHAESADCESDSREKLEADMRQYMLAACAQGWEAGQHDDMDCCNFYISDMRALLDRQAAITEREIFDEMPHVRDRLAEQDSAIVEYAEKNAELAAQLEAAHAKNRSLRQHIAKMQEGRHGWHVKGVELRREVDRLTRENISLARDLGECMAERDELKRENAKLSSDEFYLRCTLVDMDGEVV